MFFSFSGPEMLVAFHSSPFSAPLQQGVPNRGFELDVDIIFTDSDSYDFAQGTKNTCEFHINATNPGEFFKLFSFRQELSFTHMKNYGLLIYVSNSANK